jgi:hypothetical protein
VRPRRSNYNWEYEEGTVSEHTFVSGAGREQRPHQAPSGVGLGAPDQVEELEYTYRWRDPEYKSAERTVRLVAPCEGSSIHNW